MNNPPFPYFIFPNAFVDRYLAQLSGPAVACYLAIARKTHGWHKDADSISISQLERLTGLEERAIWRALKMLCELELIAAYPHPGRPTTYEINGHLMDSLGRVPPPSEGGTPPPSEAGGTPPLRGGTQNPNINQLPKPIKICDATSAPPCPPTGHNLNDGIEPQPTLDRTGATETRPNPAGKGRAATPTHAPRQAPIKHPSNKPLPDAWQGGKLAEVKTKIEHSVTFATGQGIVWPGREAKAMSTLARAKSPEEVLAILTAWESLPADHFWRRKPPTPSTLLAGGQDILYGAKPKEVTKKDDGAWTNDGWKERFLERTKDFRSSRPGMED